MIGAQLRSRNADELEAEKQLMVDELEAAKLELQAGREKLEWQVTKGGSSSKAPCDCHATKVGTQLRIAQSQLKAAQSQLEAAMYRLEKAKIQLKKEREQLEVARKNLEATKAQNDIDNTRLEAAKASLQAAKMRFEVATEQLNAAKTRFEAAKTRLDLATSSIEAEKSHLEDDKAALEIKVWEVESEKSKLEVKVSQLENDKFELGSELQGSKAEVDQRLLEELKVVMQLDHCNEINKKMQEKSAHSKVFLDLAVDGKLAGRVVIELYFDKAPTTAEYFRTLCTGEKGVNQRNGTPLHYKGSKLTHQGFHSVEWFHVQPDGTINDDIYGPICPKENAPQKHTGPGNVCMHPRPGSSYFFITGDETEEWYCKYMYIVFGQVVEGMSVMAEMSKAGNWTCVIADCGQISGYEIDCISI